MLNSQQVDSEINIKNKLIAVKLISKIRESNNKTFKKKLLPSMTVEALKGLCCKLFKYDILNMRLKFRDNEN